MADILGIRGKRECVCLCEERDDMILPRTGNENIFRGKSKLERNGGGWCGTGACKR